VTAFKRAGAGFLAVDEIMGEAMASPLVLAKAERDVQSHG